MVNKIGVAIVIVNVDGMLGIGDNPALVDMIDNVNK